MHRCFTAFIILILGGRAFGQTLEKVYYDGLDSRGNLTGGYVMVERANIDRQAPPASRDVVTVMDNGPSGNRIDIVCVGDGYTTSQLGSYAAHVASTVTGFFASEPYRSYASLFNVHRVDVVSNESGVDNDPAQGIYRDTALDMAFWCDGMERLLCVDVAKAYQHAAAAPDIDQVFAIANSTMYGGAGYTSSELATFSGANAAALELALHEMGHSLGNLADEYDYGGTARYTGPEPVERNVSIHDAAAMEALHTKWSAWLGHPGGGFGGPVQTYEGAYYYRYGVYRPTANSKMRTLGQPFNLPSVEGLILEFYGIVVPIDAHTPTGSVLDGHETVFVDPIDPLDHALDIQWFLDGAPLSGAVHETLNLRDLALAPGEHALMARVVDNTGFVRDEVQRAQRMTQEVLWTVFQNPLSSLDDTPANGIVALQSFPNPFNPRTTIRFSLPAVTSVSAVVFDASGRAVITLCDETFGAGAHQLEWDGRDARGTDLPSGVYYCRLTTPQGQSVRKLALLR